MPLHCCHVKQRPSSNKSVSFDAKPDHPEALELISPTQGSRGIASTFAEWQRVRHQVAAPAQPPPLSSLKVSAPLGVRLTLCLSAWLTYPQLWGRYICWVRPCCGCCARAGVPVRTVRRLSYSDGTVLVGDKEEIWTASDSCEVKNNLQTQKWVFNDIHVILKK